MSTQILASFWSRPYVKVVDFLLIKYDIRDLLLVPSADLSDDVLGLRHSPLGEEPTHGL